MKDSHLKTLIDTGIYVHDVLTKARDDRRRKIYIQRREGNTFQAFEGFLGACRLERNKNTNFVLFHFQSTFSPTLKFPFVRCACFAFPPILNCLVTCYIATIEWKTLLSCQMFFPNEKWRHNFFFRLNDLNLFFRYKISCQLAIKKTKKRVNINCFGYDRSRLLPDTQFLGH